MNKDRLKFRFWNEKTRRYDAICQLISVNNLEDCRLKIEQCTGLRDKKNVPIYEGDVIEYAYLVSEGRVKDTFVVRYNDYLASWQLGKEIFLTKTIAVYSEVIGNVNENPSLQPSQL